MEQNKRTDLSKLEQDYVLAKIMLNHYGMMHEYFTIQMQYYTIACCGISVGGQFKIIPAEKMISYEINTEKTKPLKLKKAKSKSPAPKKITKKAYLKECQVATNNLRDWTRKLLSWNDADVRVTIDGVSQE